MDAPHLGAMARRSRNTTEPRTFLESLMLRCEINQAELARLVGAANTEEIGRFVRGERAAAGLSPAWAARIAPFLHVAPLDLQEGRRRRVPLEWHVAAHFVEPGPDFSFRATEPPSEWFESRLRRLEECFAATIEDNSADLFGWPPGTVLFVRRAQFAELQSGTMVLVRVAPPGGDTFEVLVGRLGYTSEGDLTVSTASSNRDVPPVVIIRYAPPAHDLTEPISRFRPTLDRIDYRSAPSDRAEILGQVELPRAHR